MFRKAGKTALTVLFIFTMIGILYPTLAMSQQSGQMQQSQVDVSDQELEQFVNAMQEVNTIQQEARNDMITAVESTGLTIETYNDLVKQMQGAETMDDVDASQEQMEKVQQAADSITTIQTSMRQEMQSAMNEEACRRCNSSNIILV